MKNFTILMLLLSRVMRDFIILTLLLNGIGLIIKVMCLDAGAVVVALRPLLMLVPTDRQLGRGRKLGCFIRDGFLARAIVGRRALLVTVGLGDQSGKFCNGIASSVRSETFVMHRIRSDSVLARILPHGRSTTTKQPTPI
jgi:hypothetical protein